MFTNEEFDQLFHRLDTNKNGSISYTEYLAGAADLCILRDIKYLREAFNFFDKDKAGYLSKDQIRVSLGRGWISEEHLIELFDQVDTDKNGKICFEEFKNMMINMADEKDTI